MAEKKIQVNPLPEEAELGKVVDKPRDNPMPMDKPTPPIDKPTPPIDKPTLPMDKPILPPPASSPRSPFFSLTSFTKMEPNELYRRLLPAVLFVLTFVTVMTMLLIYMDTVALNAQQFRLNMSRDYELARIPQGSAPLVAYVRQLHLAPRPPRAPAPAPTITPSVEVMDRTMGKIYNGTFIEFLPSGPRDPTTLYLEGAREWDGVAVRAAARDYLALRTAPRAAHACLSATDHPREVSYQESESSESVFRSRVLCLPLYTLLLAGEATRAHYVLLGGGSVLAALTHVPYDDVTLRMIEVISSDPSYRNKTTEFLATKNYTVAASFPHSVMYLLKD